ncbi:MAG: hypothetical protein KC420_13285 [Myxococcales bacterium]|nr:hypothetical protein [Myxococcales bacterium]
MPRSRPWTPEGRELVETRVGLGLGLPLEPGVNALWCVSGALGFAALERTLGGPLCFADEAPEATATLAEVAAARDDAAAIAERYYVAAADRWGPELDATIRAACLARFGREPSILAPAPGLFAYSQVHVRHRFAQPFDRSTEPLLFAGDFVHAFGLFWFADDDPRLDACMVHAPYHDEPDEVWARGWIVELLGEDPGTRLVVACVPPGATLAATVDEVRGRLRPDVGAHPDARLRTDERLEIPIVDLDLCQRYEALTDRPLANPGFVGERFAECIQRVGLRLDENGAELRSEFAMGGSAGRRRRLVADRPFLVLLLQRDGDVPLVAAWIESAELLERASPRRLRIRRGDDDRLDVSAAKASLERVRPERLEVHVDLLPVALVDALIDASRRSPIRRLELRGIDDLSLERLAAGSWAELTWLHLEPDRYLSLYGETVSLSAALAGWELPALETLILEHCDLDDAGAAELFGSLPASLHHLFVLYAKVPAGPAWIAGPAMPALEHLELRADGLDDAAVERVLPRLGPALATLELESKRLSGAAALRIAEATHLSGLRRLTFTGFAFDDAAVIALAGAPHLAGLEFLRFPTARVSAHAIEILERSPYLHVWVPGMSRRPRDPRAG